MVEGRVLSLQVKEIAELLEDQLGLVRGWLMSVPSKVCWVYFSWVTAHITSAYICLLHNVCRADKAPSGMLNHCCISAGSSSQFELFA